MCKKISSKWDLEQIYYSNLIKQNVIIRPNFQRFLDESRIDSMMKTFMDNISQYEYLHTVEEITIAISPSCTWVIDGQHRLECFKRLYEDNNIDTPIDVRSIKVNDIEEANYWFSIVNKACPMPELPDGMISYAEPNALLKAIIKTFPCKPRRNKEGLFADKPTAREPRMHKATFISRIAYYNKKTPMTKEKFITLVIELNGKIRQYVEKRDYVYFRSKGLNWKNATFKQRFDTCLMDCGGFCLGLFRKHDWIKMIYESNHNIIFNLSKKTKIPAWMKKALWRKYYPNKLEITCACCKTSIISADDYEAGHIMAESKGGDTKIDNLFPMCGKCNKSLGSKNLTDVFDVIIY